MRENDFTKILDWPGYRVYRHEINEEDKTMRLWVRRKRGNRWLECSGCGRKFLDYHDCRERPVRDLPLGGVLRHGGGGSVPGALPGLRGKSGKGSAIAQQSAVQ